MTFQTFSDDCPGCRPAMVDTSTGKMLPEDSRPMRLVLEVWGNTTRKERVVFHRVCCQNSRDRDNLKIFGRLTRRMQQALAVPDPLPN